MDLEKNNINAQLSLMDDIISAKDNILYHVKNRGKEIRTKLAEAKRDSRNSSSSETGTVLLTKEQFDEIWDITTYLSDEGYFHKLGCLAETAMPEIKMKKEILDILRKS